MSSIAAQERARTPETDVGYANARIRGMKAHLLSVSFYERLMSATDLQHVIKELLETGYRKDIERHLVQGIGFTAVDEGLKDSMVETYAKVLRLLTPASKQLVNTLVGRWDVFNIKTLLRGIHGHVPVADIKQSLMPAGYMGIDELEELARLGDVKELIDTMVMWRLAYAAPLREAYPEYLESKQLTALELALDLQYARWAMERLKGNSSDATTTRRIFGMQIDMQNIITMFRMIMQGSPPDDVDKYFLEGGRSVRRDLYRKLSKAADIDDVLDLLGHTPYAEALDQAAVRYVAEQSAAVFERTLEELVMRRAVKAGVGDPHGVGVAISFLWAKQNEVTNLRIIAKGKEVGMPAERMRQELILVL